MPKYVFVCSVCEKSESKYVSRTTSQSTCSSCKNVTERKLPNIAQQQVNETIDQYTGVKRDQNHVENIKDRRDEHYWNVEVPRFVQHYSTETCIENGWLVYNEKGELVINKPPSKR